MLKIHNVKFRIRLYKQQFKEEGCNTQEVTTRVRALISEAIDTLKDGRVYDALLLRYLYRLFNLYIKGNK